MPGTSRFDLVFGGDLVAELDRAAAVEAAVGLFVVQGGTVGVGGHAGEGEGGDGFADWDAGGEGAEETWGGGFGWWHSCGWYGLC